MNTVGWMHRVVTTCCLMMLVAEADIKFFYIIFWVVINGAGFFLSHNGIRKFAEP